MRTLERSHKQPQYSYVRYPVDDLSDTRGHSILISFTILAKALELFMQSLIDQACVETRSRNAKRLSVAHL
jgi:hypothetical protein